VIFALATDERTLFVFASSQEAISYCEGPDAEDGVWRFWDKHGAPLRAHFSRPNRRGRFSIASGVYALLPNADGEPLAIALSDADQLHSNSFFASLAEIEAHLAANRATGSP
jgi:hypothetical protein